MTIGGSPIIAIATDNLRLFPPLREHDGLLACLNKSNSTNFSMTTCPDITCTKYMPLKQLEPCNTSKTSLLGIQVISICKIINLRQ